MGSKGSQSTNTVQNTAQTYMANPAISGIGNQAISQAQAAGSQPFQMPQAPVADFNADQQAAFQQYRGLPGIPAPYLNQANQAYGNAASPINAGDINQFYDPMASRITSNLQDVFGHQNVGTQGNLVQQAGGVGADRIAVGMGEAQKAQGSIANNAYLGAYQQALQAANQQKQLQMGAGAGFTNLAGAATQDNIMGTNALLQSGQLQQNLSQQQMNSPYQQRLAQLAYPYQNAQFLAGITGGLAPAFGGTTTGNQNGQTTPPQPSALSQVLGIGTAGAGLYGAFGGFNGGSGKGSDAGTINLDNTNPSLITNGYAEGGGTDEEDIPHFPGGAPNGDLMPIPFMPLHGGAGHSAPLTGGINFPQPQQQQQQQSGGGFGDVLKTAASIVPFFLKDGGVAGYEAGGDPYPIAAPEAINPWILNPSNRRDTSHDNDPPVIMRESPSVKQWRQDTGARPATTGYPSAAFADRFGAMAPAAAATGDGEFNNPSRVAAGTIPLPRPYPNSPAAAQVANAYRMASPTAKPENDEVSSQSYVPRGRETSPREVLRSMQPQASQPYPDALQRDMGQTATRSPWMALVNAGAAMASTPGPLGVSLGKGMLAGTKSLDDQRKELRGEQEINQKAQHLYQTAKTELDKYNRMDAFQEASIRARHREIDQSGATGDNSKLYMRARVLARQEYNDMMKNDIKFASTPRSAEEMEAMIDARARRIVAARATGEAPAAAQPGTAPAAGPPQSSAPARTVIQNGHSYTLQPDGSYK